MDFWNLNQEIVRSGISRTSNSSSFAIIWRCNAGNPIDLQFDSDHWKLHDIIFDATVNPRLIQIIGNLRDQFFCTIVWNMHKG